MKKYHIILGMFCLLAGTACSDDDAVINGNNGNETEEPLPPLPTEVITRHRMQMAITLRAYPLHWLVGDC